MTDVKIKKAVIREDLLSITNDYRKAIILNQFIYWSERVSDADKFIKKENEIAKNNGEEERELFYGWIYKTAEELADEVMLGLSASQIRRYISELVDMGYISKRNNPKYKWDRTLQYRVNLVNIAKDLKKNGYPLSDYRIEIPENEKFNAHECAINNEPMENQTQVSDEAIPKSTNIDYLNKDYDSEITREVHTYLVSGGGNVSDGEVMMFMSLCRYQHLNPFLREAYLIKYGSNDPATIVTGKDVFTKRANADPRYKGKKAGIIVIKKDGAVEEREGTR